MSNIHGLQREHYAWLIRNFPKQQPHQPLLGLAEEVGELSHAHLKMEQGIRGDWVQHMNEKADAVGDIFIYLMSYCNSNEINLENVVEKAWAEVSERDWITDPHEGRPQGLSGGDCLTNP